MERSNVRSKKDLCLNIKGDTIIYEYTFGELINERSPLSAAYRIMLGAGKASKQNENSRFHSKSRARYLVTACFASFLHTRLAALQRIPCDSFLHLSGYSL